MKPNVVIKNIKKFQGSDGVGLNADIYINGLKCMHLHDPANGGCYEYVTYSYIDSELIKFNIDLLDGYIDSLPRKQIFSDRPDILIKIDLDFYIDEILMLQENEKVLKSFKKKESNHIIYGSPNGNKYYLQKYKLPLSEIPLAVLQEELNKIKTSQFKKDFVFFNTNLEKLGIILN